MDISTNCRMCGAGDGRAFQGQHVYVKCKACGGITAALTQDQYEDLNPSYDSGPDGANTAPDEMRAYLAVEDKKSFLKPHISALGATGRMLDVGCGAGGFLLAAAELGWSALGVEPSEEHSTVGRGMGLDIRTGYFEMGMFPEASFDLVVLSHVIEHIHDPKSFIANLAKLLRPGGRLLVVTPNAGSLTARLSGRFWVMLKPVDHVTMFTEAGFRALGADQFGEVTFQQSEFIWEPLASLAAAGRDALLRKRAQQVPAAAAESAPAPEVTNKSRFAWSLRFQLIRLAFTAGGWPLHAVAKATGSQACLTMVLTRA